jgi:uncharacterized protein YndB with AHSA1/START domain
MATSMRAKASVTVDRPIEDAFAYLADGRNMQEWVSGVGEVAVVEGTSGTADAVYEYDYTDGGRTERMRTTVATFDHPTRLVLDGQSESYPFESDFRLEPRDSGGTLVTFRLAAGADGTFTRVVFTLFAPLLRRFMRKRMTTELEALRANVEREAAAATDGTADASPRA